MSCLALLLITTLLEVAEFYTPVPAECRDCVNACKMSTGFIIICTPPQRWHTCPLCGKEWYGMKDFGCLHSDSDLFH